MKSAPVIPIIYVHTAGSGPDETTTSRFSLATTTLPPAGRPRVSTTTCGRRIPVSRPTRYRVPKLKYYRSYEIRVSSVVRDYPFEVASSVSTFRRKWPSRERDWRRPVNRTSSAPCDRLPFSFRLSTVPAESTSLLASRNGGDWSVTDGAIMNLAYGATDYRRYAFDCIDALGSNVVGVHLDGSGDSLSTTGWQRTHLHFYLARVRTSTVQ